MADPEFLQKVLSTLPGVDPSSEAIQNVMGTLTNPEKDDAQEDKKTQDTEEPMEEDPN